MLSNPEIFEFFKDYPKHLISKCIEEVLVFGINQIKEKFNRPLSLSQLLKLNTKDLYNTQSVKMLNHKSTRKKLSHAQTKPALPHIPKENLCPDTTCLPLKFDCRRTQSTQYFCSTQASEKDSHPKQDLSESLQKDLEVIKQADEFLKNPFYSRTNFSSYLKKPAPVVFIDSHLFSTIEISSPTWNSEIV